MSEAGARSGRHLTRRNFVRNAGAGAVAFGAATNPLIAPAIAGVSPGKRVAVLGGGMAGLTVAHELAERGFKVHVYEPVALGGKARSIDVPDTAAGGRKDLPGEHGFRFFPGFYHHIPDTMRRIPDGDEPGRGLQQPDRHERRALGPRQRPRRRAALRHASPTRPRRRPSTACGRC